MIYFAFIFLTLIVLAIAFHQWQHFMIFTPTYFRTKEIDDEFELVYIKTDDGVELEGVVYEPQIKKTPHTATLLFFAGRSHDSIGLIHQLSDKFPHARIITFNYRSYGKSGGVVNEKNILADGVKIAEVVQNNYGDFYVLGFSIGSSVAAYVASKRKVLGLFLVGSFDSIGSLAKTKYGLNPYWLLRYKFDNTKIMHRIDAKTYLFVSKDDEITYIQNARKLKNHVKNLALYRELEGLNHKELLWDSAVIDEINRVVS